MDGRGIMKTRKQSARRTTTAQRGSANGRNPDLSNERACDFREGNPFGPQTVWSSLLGQRELLQTEIRRGTHLLEQWRKEQLETANALLAPLAVTGADAGAHLGATSLSTEQIQEFLASWVGRLEQTLVAISGRIDGEPAHEPESHGDESLFELLRGAG